MKNKIKQLISKVRSNEFFSKLFKNFSFAIIGEGGASFINLFVIVVLIKLIGNDGYGTLILAQSYMLIMDSIINLQCWKGVIKFGEEALANNKKETYMGYIKLGTILDIGTAILGCIICFFATDIIGQIFNWSEVLIACSKVFSIVILFHFSGTPTAILRIENKFSWVSIQKISVSLLKIILLVIILFVNKNISILNCVIIYAITDIIGHIILIIMALYIVHKKNGILNVIKSKLPTDSKGFIKFTLWTTLSDVVDIPVQYFDVFIVSKLGIEMVSIFKFFKQIVAIFSKLTTPLYQAIFPQFSNLSATGKQKEGYSIVLKIRNFILKYMLPIAVLCGISSVLWLDWIFDYTYAQYWYVLTLYLSVHLIALSYTTIHPYFVSIGQVYYSFKYVLISNIVYIIVSILLIDYLNMIGLIFSYFIQFMVVIILKNNRIKKILEK